ncbi:MAG: hypothetical protein K5876_07485 [Ruminiclostridium sp.]|nr:hypothetical protein [Ruminiclostridium sp.]
MKGAILKALAVAAFAAVVFPFIFSCDINTYGNISALRLLYYYGIGAVVSLLGFLTTFPAKKRPKLRILFRVLGVLTWGAGFLSLTIGGDGVTVFAFGVLCVFMYFLGERAGYKNFADMFPLSSFAFYIALTVGCYIFARVAARETINETAADTIVAAFAAEFVAAALLVNQSGIFERANMRRETRTALPKGLAGYNAALILGFTVTALVLLVFRKPLAWLLEQIGILFMKVSMFIASLFTAEYMEIQIGEQAEPGQMSYAESGLTYIFEALVVVILVVLAIIFREKIFKGIKAFFAFLGNLFSGHPEESERPDFIDVFENYSSKHRRREPDSIYAVRKKYASERDPVKKFRFGYRILLLRILEVNRRLTPADTVSMQAERGADYFGKERMTEIAEIYDGVRYGGRIPDSGDLEKIDGFTGHSR